jgi:hypothetical protein
VRLSLKKEGRKMCDATVDLTREEAISFEQARLIMPPKRSGKPVHAETIRRWVTVGCQTPAGPVRLEAVRLGSRWITTREAIGRFMRRLTQAQETPHAS